MVLVSEIIHASGSAVLVRLWSHSNFNFGLKYILTLPKPIMNVSVVQLLLNYFACVDNLQGSVTTKNVEGV